MEEDFLVSGTASNFNLKYYIFVVNDKLKKKLMIL